MISNLTDTESTNVAEQSSGDVNLPGVGSFDQITRNDGAAKENELKEQSDSDSCLVKVSNFVGKGLASIFFSIGRFVGRFPCCTISAAVALSFLLSLSLFCCFKQESESSKLFVPQGTQSLIDQADVVEFWGQNKRLVTVEFTTDSEPLGNVLSRDPFIAGLQLLNDIQEMKVELPNSGVFDFESLCVKVPTLSGSRCLLGSVYEAWNNNITALENDANISGTLYSFFNGVKDLDLFLGGTTYSASGLPESGKVIRISMFLEGNATDPNPNDGKNEKRDPVANAWEEALVKMTREDASDYIWSKWIVAYPQSIYSFVEEVGGAIGRDVGIMSASYFIIILYIIIVLQEHCDRVRGSFTIALLSVLNIGLGILSAFGLCQTLGFKYGNTHSILPFIVLGVGADGCFILVNAFRRTDPSIPVEERSGQALSHAGVSLAVSSLTNVAAFAIGSSTVIPDLSSFCKYASLSLFFLWIYFCTFFMACLVLNEKRVASRRIDVLCCFHDCRPSREKSDEGDDSSKESRASRWMRNSYAPAITSNKFRIPVLLLATAFVSLCAYEITTLSVEATGTNFLPDNSYLKTNFDLQSKYFGGFPTDVQVVVKEFDFSKKQELVGLASRYRFPHTYKTDPPFIIPAFRYWLESFVSDINNAANGQNVTSFPVDLTELPSDPTLDGLRFPADTELFYKYLRLWLDDPLGGTSFKNDIIFADESRSAIIRARVEMQHIPIGDFDSEGVFQQDATKIVQAMDKMYEISDSFSFAVYPFAFQYTDEWSSFKVIGSELLRNVILALTCVLVVVTLLIGHPITSALVFLACTITIVELLGTNALIGLSVDTVVTVCVVLAVGISVDYSAHIGYGFMLEIGSRKDRIASVLGDVGVPVFHGAMSTFLAIVLQSLSSSYVFRVVFYEFFFAILFSALNGIVILPMMLSLVGPQPYRSIIATSKRVASP